VDTSEIQKILSLEPKRLVESTWLKHLPFGYWITANQKPEMIVELGVYTGASFSIFCQSIKENHLKTKVFGVDTFQGDEHAGFFTDEVYNNINNHVNKNYSEFASLMRMTFDEALVYFSDGSIDLLHIDGLHTYEAVQHDFESWLPKMKNNGIVIFHDTMVRTNNFGVWKLWEEIRNNHYQTFEFHYGCGLGVLFLGESEFSKRFMIPEDSDVISFVFEKAGERIQSFYSSLEAEQAKAEAQQAKAEAQQAKAEAQQAKAEAQQAKAETVAVRKSRSFRFGFYALHPWRLPGDLWRRGKNGKEKG